MSSVSNPNLFIKDLISGRFLDSSFKFLEKSNGSVFANSLYKKFIILPKSTSLGKPLELVSNT